MRESVSDRLTRRHAQLNLATRDHWELYASHRARVMALLDGEPGGRAAGVLGAGNCNDVDLAALAARFDQVHLIDLDGAALGHAVAHQPASVAAKLVPAAGVDLGGVLHEIAGRKGAPPTVADVEAALRASEKGPTIPVGELDLALSACVLTQLILSVAEWVGERHPRCLDLVRAVRTAHLAALARSLRSGGLGVVVSDMVSSDTDPGLAATGPGALRGRMEALVRRGNFFTGVNPYLVAAALKTQPELSSLARDVALHEPWIWQIAPRRWYLVFAVGFRRAPG